MTAYVITDSQVASLALGYALVAAVAALLGSPAGDRVDRPEDGWRVPGAIDEAS
jgi:hypothetical protein